MRQVKNNGITKTQKINNYLNDTIDINDRVQNIIDSFNNGEIKKYDGSILYEDNAPRNLTKQENDSKLEEYYNSLSDDEKNKIVKFVKERDKRKSDRSAKYKNIRSAGFDALLSGLIWILIALIHLIRYIGLGLTFVLFPYAIFRWTMRENEHFNSTFNYGSKFGGGADNNQNNQNNQYNRYRGIWWS